VTGRPISIVHVFPSFAHGGQQRRLASLVGGLGAQFRHTIYAIDGDLSCAELIDGPNVEARPLTLAKTSGVSFDNLAKISKILRGDGADILCTYNWGAIEAAAANAMFTQAPHLHFEDGFGPGEDPHQQPARRIWARRLALSRARTIVPSSQLYMIARNIWKMPARRLIRIPNGVDIHRFSPPQSNRAGDRHAGPVTVGFVGALRPEKNVARLIRAVDAARANGAPVRLAIVGSGPDEAALRAAAAQSGASADIRFYGAMADPKAAYDDFDIFALSSDTEQAPFSLLEAMACGLPVASPDIGDIRSMVAEENRPHISPMRAETALAETLGRLASDAELRARLGAANRERAVSEFGMAQMVERYRVLFNETARRP
jgi:glycosyltransferase involved in cell wall biosynthesis